MSTAEFLSTTTKAKGALFNVAPEDRKENGPIMTGSIEIGSEKFHISGFTRTASSTGELYLSVALSARLPDGYTESDRENQLRYYGKLFRQSEKRSEASPDYTGFITVLPCTTPNQYTNDEWDAAPNLQVWAWRKRNADGTSRISLSIAPREVAAEEVNF